MFHGYNAFNLINHAETNVREEKVIRCPHVVSKSEWRKKLLESPPLKYATVIDGLPCKMKWDLDVKHPVVKTYYYTEQARDDFSQQPIHQDLVWCMDKKTTYDDDDEDDAETEPYGVNEYDDDYPERSYEDNYDDYGEAYEDAFYD